MAQDIELITVGDELLLGFTVDTNGAFLARALADLGIAVARRTAVGDQVESIEAAVGEALDRTGAVITTGGLGPTADDVTRDAVARVFGRELCVDESHLEWMRERWKKRFGREMPESNRRQAMIPDGARKLENRHGSAPGVLIEDDRGWVMLLPGVPRELRGMTADVLLPFLAERGVGSGGECIRSRTWRTTGVPESLLADRLSALGSRLSALGDLTPRAEGRGQKAESHPVSLAYLPGPDGVDLRVTVRARDAKSADRALEHAGAALRSAVGESIYAEGGDDLASVVLDLCRARRLKMAVAESCTGGLLGARITAIPGASDVFGGGVIAYDDAVKLRELGVSERELETHGAVSEQVVRAMALGVRKRFAADVSLAITGVAGPTGGTPEKPVGLVWICGAVGERVEPRKLQLWGDRQEIRHRASQAALELARRLLSDA